MAASTLLTELAQHAHVDTDLATRAACGVDGLVPAAVVTPASESDLAAALACAARHGAAVAPRGGGSKVGLGAPPARLDLVLSTARLDGIVAYEPADLTVTVQAGMPLARLQQVLRNHGQMLPVDPPAADRATVGGIVSAGAMGPRRLLYGSLRDLVLGMRVALADGRVIRCGGRVVKNVAGYDMCKLFTGALGTLGVITEVTFKVRPLPEAQATLVAAFDGPDPCLACAEAILNSELLPAAVVALNPVATRVLDVPGPYALAVALEEVPAAVRYQADRIAQEVAAQGGRAPEELCGGVEEAFWDGVRNFAARAGSALGVKVNTVISRVGTEFAKAGAVPGAAAVAWVGTGHVYLYAPPAEASDLEQVARSWLAPAEGTAVLELAPVDLRRRLPVWGDPGPAFALMQGLKQTFDPGRILNPGRFIGGL